MLTEAATVMHAQMLYDADTFFKLRQRTSMGPFHAGRDTIAIGTNIETSILQKFSRKQTQVKEEGCSFSSLNHWAV
jgi:hypothetical protein